MKKYRIGLGAEDICYVVKELNEEQYKFLCELQKEFDDCGSERSGWIEIMEIENK